MAKMYPCGIVSFINSSEREFYELFQNSPTTKDWTVFYSHRMVSARYLNEIDFLILIPDLGVSLVELKANNPVIVSPDTFSYNYMGKLTEKENPFRKIKNLISQFKTVLKLPGEELDKIFVSHILIFPNYKGFFEKKICFSSNSDNYINAFTDKKDIPARIIELHKKQSQNTKRKDPDPDKSEKMEILAKIEKVLKCEFDIDERILEREFEKEKEIVSRKSLLARWLMIESMHRVLLSGPAGTGKTFCCIQQLIKKANEGLKCAYFCQSSLAAIGLSRNFSKTQNVEIFDLRSYLVRKLRKAINDKSSTQELLEEMLKLSPRAQYDFIAADDAEFYLSDKFLLLVNKILKNGIKDGLFWIAVDEDFMPMEGKSSYNDTLANFDLKGLKIKLVINHRHSQSISSILSSFAGKTLYEDSENFSLSSIQAFSYSQSQQAYLDLILEPLLQKFKTSEIALISVKDIKNSLAFKLREENRGWGKKMAELSSSQEGLLRYGDVNSFCGLETKIAIITDIDQDFFSNPDAGLILYKAASKGTFKIIFLVEEKVKDLFSAYTSGEL